MDPKSRAFKKLQSEWYAKLEKAGFEDIERDEDALHRYHSRDFQDRVPVPVFQARQRYFELAAQLLHTHTFTSPRERRIWKLHTQGYSTREIAAKCGYKHHSSTEDIINRISRFIKV